MNTNTPSTTRHISPYALKVAVVPGTFATNIVSLIVQGLFDASIRKSELTVSIDEHATDYSTASSAETMVDTLKNTLRASTQLRGRVVGYVTAARGPNGGMSYPLDKFERQHPPRRCQPRYVQETENVPA